MLSSLRRLVSSNGAAVGGDRRSSQSILSSPRKRRVASDGQQDLFSAFVNDWTDIEVSWPMGGVEILGSIRSLNPSLRSQADLTSPDQAALHHGVSRSSLPQALERLGQAIVQESLTTDEVMDGLGPCMEYLLKKDGEHAASLHGRGILCISDTGACISLQSWALSSGQLSQIDPLVS